jgi:hypothetical protein
MKLPIILLLCLCAVAAGQTTAVTKNPNNNNLTGDLVLPADKTFTFYGKLQTGIGQPVTLGTFDQDYWGFLSARVSVAATDQHGLISRAYGGGGIAIVGISENGAMAGKFVQQNYFTSPSLYVGRTASGFPNNGSVTTPSLMVTTPASGYSQTPIAQFTNGEGDVALSVNSDGTVVAPNQQYLDSNALVTLSFLGSNYLDIGSAATTYLPRVGVTNGTNAPTGHIGQYLTATGNSASLTNTVASNTASLTLSAGDWDVEGVTTYTRAATTVVSYTQQGITTTSATMPVTAGTFTSTASAISDVVPSTFATPTVRLSLSSATTVYLVSRAGFTTSTLSTTGFIRARRVR